MPANKLEQKYNKSNKFINRSVLVALISIILLSLMRGGGEGGLIVAGLVFGYILIPCNMLIIIFSIRSIYLSHKLSKDHNVNVSLSRASIGIVFIFFELVIVILKRKAS